jgi:hypothetical protein
MLTVTILTRHKGLFVYQQTPDGIQGNATAGREEKALRIIHIYGRAVESETVKMYQLEPPYKIFNRY